MDPMVARRTAAASSSLAEAAAAASARPKLVLGIETSCDDTGAAVVTTDGRVLGEAIATQVEVHAPWGRFAQSSRCHGWELSCMERHQCKIYLMRPLHRVYCE